MKKLRLSVIMKKFKQILFLTIVFPISILAQNVANYVDPFIGTGAAGRGLSGNNFPGATAPFGMIQLSPDTRNAPDWDVACGYNYNDTKIYGFSHTHLSGTGVAELFDVMLIPSTESLDNLKIKNEFPSEFSHSQESARAGYYQVKLLDTGINAELTATTRAGFHKYSYPSGRNQSLVIDLNHSRDKGSWGTQIALSQIEVVDAQTVRGYRVITGWGNLRKVCFYAKLSKPIKEFAVKNGDNIFNNTSVVNGKNLKAYLNFDESNNSPLLVKVGLSAVSMDNAKLNLEKEVPAWNFEAVAQSTYQEWERELGKIKVKGTEEQKKIFYTALYHSFLQPNTLSDVNGQYTATDFSVQTTNGVQYSTFSLWDTYRAAHPLYTLVQQERSADFVNSMLAHYKIYGYLPIWQLWGQENYCMIGNHAIPVVVDAVMKGIGGIDIELAYEAVRNSSLRNHLNSPFDVWEKYGYMPENIQTQSVSITLEMAFDDWCVAQLAKKLGKDADYERFIARSEYYKNLHNPKTRFFQSKNDKGEWIEPFDPFKYGANGGYPFTEGNAWQYYWYVPHNVPNLIALTGGNKAFAAKLDEFFTNDFHSELNDNASGFIGQYAHGNEPSHHVAYLYNYVGQPKKTQFYTAKIMNELYNTSSSGYAGNDDCGQMSAWYVLSAMGLYPVNPTNGVYDFGCPLLEHVEIELPNGKIFKIIAPKKSSKDIYIQSIKLNGKPYKYGYIAHQNIMDGGILEFTMSAK